VIFFWRKKVRAAIDEGSSWKVPQNKNTHVRDAKYLLLKNAWDNVDFTIRLMTKTMLNSELRGQGTPTGA
jgi:hypothetical protein